MPRGGARAGAGRKKRADPAEAKNRLKVSFEIGEELFARLEAFSKRAGISKSEIIRSGIVFFINSKTEDHSHAGIES